MKKTGCNKIKMLCGLFYTLCLLQVLGISVYQNQKDEEEEETNKVDDAIAFVSSSMVEEPPKIAITFDDGPSSQCTGRLLDGLKERNVKATFFLIGENAKENPELVKRLDEEGHLIGNHTYHHVEITKVSDEEAKKEILDTNKVITSITGKSVEYMRPPFGLWQRNLEMEIEVLPVMWTIDPLDWTTENVDEIVNKVVTEAEENDIILLHDCYDSSVDAALRIIDILQKKGFEFVTVDQLIMN
ncbi:MULTISPECIES: polysaccharide deacetylase family protein [Lachnospiraceae]|uniref:polysaccharide deacetylase family protein n=2 Tax=Lachnospirales TaxID=3085636 RepID=UPI001F221388|nr:polysaccharide deacetylase family protein [Faecalicatena contorta]